MSLCTHKQKSHKSENVAIYRANSFTSTDRKMERKIAGKYGPFKRYITLPRGEGVSKV